jgi:putative transcriptional regulator
VSSTLIESLRADMTALQDCGAIDKLTMRDFDAAYPLPLRSFSADDIKQLRETLRFSQPVFAHHLHITASTIRKWEQGDSRPTGPALKLLNLIADKGLQAIL